MKSKGLPLHSIVSFRKSFPVIRSHEICDTAGVHGTAIDSIIPYGMSTVERGEDCANRWGH